MIKNYTFIYFVSTQRNLPFLIISDTVYLALLCRHQLAAHQKKLGGGRGGGGGVGGSPLSVVVTFGISRSVFEARENTLKSLVAVHGHLKH